jgi:hypothetical protein
MATGEILAKFLTPVTVTITLTSLANAAGRIGTEIDNTTVRATRGYFALKFKSATAPTVNTPLKIYLIKNSGAATNIQAGVQSNTSYTPLGATDAAVTVEPLNAQLLDVAQVTATANAFYTLITEIVMDPGPKFSPLVWNAIGQALSATAGDFLMQWVPLIDEIQP